jgi:hypothetical protein
MALPLAACAGSSRPVATASSTALSRPSPRECAPFARDLTQVALRGPAYTWWRESEGLYRHSQRPEVGAILVFKRTRHMPEGHVAVVSAVLSNREILVSQANWVRHRAQFDQPVLDVSPRNDWTEVRVWWEPSGTFGRETYATYGFILPPSPPPRQVLLATFPAAARD